MVEWPGETPMGKDFALEWDLTVPTPRLRCGPTIPEGLACE